MTQGQALIAATSNREFFSDLDNSSPATDSNSENSSNATITLAGKQYALNDLSDPARQLVSAIRASEEEMKSTRNQLALMDVGRRALVAQLRLAVENPDAFQRLQSPDQETAAEAA